MNYCKIIIQPTVNIFFVRKFSIFNNINCVSYNSVERLYKKYYTPTINVQRQLSLQGFVDWQEQIYNSISNSYIVGKIQDSLLYIHDVSGMPWWATIISSTLLLRGLMTMPLAVYQAYILAKVENIGLELKELIDELKKETTIAKKIYNLNDKQTVMLYKRSLKKQWNNLIVRDNCHPLKSTLVIWLQLPVWICTSFALRNLVQMQPVADTAALITFTELTVGGFGWIPNLTVPDHSLILPILFGITNLAVIEIQKMSKLREPSKLYNIMTNVFRTISIVMIPVAANVPSCMCLYWTVSSSFGLVQNLALLSPQLRRKLGIPLAPSEHEHPYKHMAEEIKSKFSKIIPTKS